MLLDLLHIKDVRYVEVNLLQGDQVKEDYKKINPQHAVPLLQDDDFYIWDSHAIAVYLVTKFGKDDSLYPESPSKRAIIDQRLHFDSGILFPALRSTAEPVIYWGEKSYRPENIEKIKSAYAFTDKFLTSTWLAGNELTLADICVTTISSMTKIVPVDSKLYPNLTKWLAKCSELEIHKKYNDPGLKQFADLLKERLS